MITLTVHSSAYGTRLRLAPAELDSRACITRSITWHDEKAYDARLL